MEVDGMILFPRKLSRPSSNRMGIPMKEVIEVTVVDIQTKSKDDVSSGKNHDLT